MSATSRARSGRAPRDPRARAMRTPSTARRRPPSCLARSASGATCPRNCSPRSARWTPWGVRRARTTGRAAWRSPPTSCSARAWAHCSRGSTCSPPPRAPARRAHSPRSSSRRRRPSAGRRASLLARRSAGDRKRPVCRERDATAAPDVARAGGRPGVDRRGRDDVRRSQVSSHPISSTAVGIPSTCTSTWKNQWRATTAVLFLSR